MPDLRRWTVALALGVAAVSVLGAAPNVRDPIREPDKANPAVQQAISAGLKWLAKQQRMDGSWTFATGPNSGHLTAPTTATYMTLLAFLKAGQTHKEGDYKAEVAKGLAFVLPLMKAVPEGADVRDGQSMYSQALGTMMLCEAYARTKDEKFLKPAQQAVNFIINAQDPKGGGWRYNPKQPGDTSVVGWQMTALKAGMDLGFPVPKATLTRASSFLDSVQTGGGTAYKYEPSGGDANTCMTAVGLLCRLRLGVATTDKTLMTGVKTISDSGMNNDLYFDYYATSLMCEYGGADWDQWEHNMQDFLVKRQDRDGSWWGLWGHIPDNCGRVGETAVCLWLLETTKKTP